MADKRSATSTAKPVSTRTKVQTITITAEQAMNFLNRMTGALERAEKFNVPYVSQEYLPSPGTARDSQQPAANATGKAPKPEPLDNMILTTRDLARSVCELAGGLRARLYNDPPPPDGNGCQTMSRGLTKDGVSQTHDMLLQLQQDILAIGDYLTT